MRRLREIGDASSLILQFGPHKGATLAEVAMQDPDYVRGLVNRAQRPEVREAAGRLVSALEAAAEHKPHTPRESEELGQANRSARLTMALSVSGVSNSRMSSAGCSNTSPPLAST